MRQSRVVCLGEILFDHLADQVGLSLPQVQSWTPYPGGAPANTACALVKLGTPASFIGAIGTDDLGEQLLELLQKIGVDCRGVQRHPTAPTRQVYVIRSVNGDREFAGFGGEDTTQFADAFLDSRHLPENLFVQADFLVLGTLELAYPHTREAIFQALTWTKTHDLQVMVDVNWRPMFWPDPEMAQPLIKTLLQQADFIKFAAEEADWLFGTTDPGTLSNHLQTAQGILVSQGEQGCAYFLGGQVGQVPGFEVPALDTTGAGDGFWAGFIHQLCEFGLDSLSDPDQVQKIVTFANATGALTTLKPGAIDAQPTAAEVAHFLAAHC